MSGPLGSQQLLYSSAAASAVTATGQSLRFEDGDSAYLSWTPASAGNRKTWTWSGWVKRANLLQGYIFGNLDSSALNGAALGFTSTHNIIWLDFSTGYVSQLETNAVFRDVSAWYHLLVKYDTAQTTASDRIKIYVNNFEQSLSTSTYPSQNYDGYINNTNPHAVGRGGLYNGSYLDGYLANVTFIDGQALTPTSFGEYDDTLWKPKSDADITSLTFGTNGFYLNFKDSAAIGDDTSGNANDWTANNLVATDVVLDAPVTGGNFAVMNPLDDTGVNTSEGNLKVTPSSDFKIIQGTIACNKNYFEGRFVSGGGGSIQDMDFGVYASNGNFTRINGNGSIYKDGSLVSSNTAYGVGDIVGIAVDVPSGTIQFYRNGTANGSAATVNTTDEYLPHFRGANARVGHFNFGQDSSFAGNETPQGNTDDNGVGDFYYAPPSGFLALTTGNLPTPTITAPDEYFNTVLYAGNNTTGHAITGVNFQSDWTWIKLRNGASGHRLVDAVRGVTKYLDSTGTSAETTNTDRVTSFDSDGFTLGNSATVNGSFNYVAWNWLAGNGTSSNTDGDQTTTISANPTAGFSVGTFTAPSSYINFTTGHGLSAAPDMVVLKRRDSTSDWWVWHKDLPNAATGRALKLNLSSVEIQGAYFDQSNMTTTTVGYTSGVFITSATYVQYIFHEVEGYSKIGSYTGNGSSDGVYVHCGFRPAWVMVKAATGSVQHWWMFDNKREGYNVDNDQLYANLTSAEGTSDILDFTSNGFKLRNSTAATNGSGQTFIFLAFAEAPFKSANAR